MVKFYLNLYCCVLSGACGVWGAGDVWGAGGVFGAAGAEGAEGADGAGGARCASTTCGGARPARRRASCCNCSVRSAAPASDTALELGDPLCHRRKRFRFALTLSRRERSQLRRTCE